MNFLLRWLGSAVAVGVAIWIIPGVDAVSENPWGTIAVVALIVSLLNASLKPLLQILGAPITVLTLGLFYLIVNTFLLYIAMWLSNGIFDAGFEIASFGSAFVASIIISIVSSILNSITGATD